MAKGRVMRSLNQPANIMAPLYSLRFLFPVMLCLFSCLSFASADMGQAYRDAEKMDNASKSKDVTSFITQIKRSLKLALKNLQQAHNDSDVKQTVCIKGHLATIKGLLRIAEDAEVSLKEAMITEQIDIINHEYVKIKMALDRSRRAQSLLVGCTGDLNDPMKASQQSVKPEIYDKSVQDYTPSSDDSSVIVYDPIASERPEAISLSE